MLVHFRKTGSRRYGVFVEREGAPSLQMDPAPGFDDYLPHDLLHFVAEAEWGIDGGVFGQLAAGVTPARFGRSSRRSSAGGGAAGELVRVAGTAAAVPS